MTRIFRVILPRKIRVMTQIETPLETLAYKRKEIAKQTLGLLMNYFLRVVLR